MTSTELNYEIYSNETLRIVFAFKKYIKYLDSTEYLIVVFSDHKT
jgi:hypothetical protein